MAFLKFMIGGMLIGLPAIIVTVFVLELMSEFPQTRAIFGIVIALAASFVIGIELLISAANPKSK